MFPRNRVTLFCFGWYESNPNLFHLMTGAEPVGEGDGMLAEMAEAIG